MNEFALNFPISIYFQGASPAARPTESSKAPEEVDASAGTATTAIVIDTESHETIGALSEAAPQGRPDDPIELVSLLSSDDEEKTPQVATNAESKSYAVVGLDILSNEPSEAKEVNIVCSRRPTQPPADDPDIFLISSDSSSNSENVVRIEDNSQPLPPLTQRVPDAQSQLLSTVQLDMVESYTDTNDASTDVVAANANQSCNEHEVAADAAPAAGDSGSMMRDRF